VDNSWTTPDPERCRLTDEQLHRLATQCQSERKRRISVPHEPRRHPAEILGSSEDMMSDRRSNGASSGVGAGGCRGRATEPLPRPKHGRARHGPPWGRPVARHGDRAAVRRGHPGRPPVAFPLSPRRASIGGRSESIGNQRLRRWEAGGFDQRGDVDVVEPGLLHQGMELDRIAKSERCSPVRRRPKRLNSTYPHQERLYPLDRSVVG
jgi:hypothetical protein